MHPQLPHPALSVPAHSDHEVIVPFWPQEISKSRAAPNGDCPPLKHTAGPISGMTAPPTQGDIAEAQAAPLMGANVWFVGACVGATSPTGHTGPNEQPRQLLAPRSMSEGEMSRHAEIKPKEEKKEEICTDQNKRN